MTLEQDLIKFIRENLISGEQSADIDRDEPLIDRGVIDSIGLLQLMMFVEERTGVRIPDDQVTFDNFQTVAGIAQMVDGLRARRQT